MNFSHANKTRYCWILVKTLNKSCLKVSVIFIGEYPPPPPKKKAQFFYFNNRNGIEDEKHFLMQCMEDAIILDRNFIGELSIRF